MKKVKLYGSIIAMAAVLLLGAWPCVGAEVHRIALVLPGSIADAGWNAHAYQALQELAAQGYETAYTESCPIPDMEAALRTYAEEGYDLIIGHGFEFGTPTLAVAPSFPNTYFFVSGKCPKDVAIPPNVQFMDQLEFEGAFLCGVVAGLMTRTNKIAHVAGMEIPTQLANLAAYTKGAELVNPDVKVLSVITGTFEDPEKGREAALSLIALGADVLFQTADSTGMGAMQAAKEKGVYIIGYAGDQRDIAPDLVLTSNIVDITKAIVLQVERIEAGTFGGSVWRAGIKEGVVDIGPFGPMVPEEVKEIVTILRRAIISGYLQPPEIYERLK